MVVSLLNCSIGATFGILQCPYGVVSLDSVALADVVLLSECVVGNGFLQDLIIEHVFRKIPKILDFYGLLSINYHLTRGWGGAPHSDSYEYYYFLEHGAV
jgi:hypothetical protein